MEDRNIIDLYRKRDTRAISETSKKYGNYCRGIAKRILTYKEDIAECVNDTYWNTWNAIPPQNPSNFSAFLAKIVRNLSFNRYKHIHAEKRGGNTLPLVLGELAEIVSSTEDTAFLAENNHLSMQIDAFLDNLPPKKRQIFVRRYFYTDSITQIAHRYGMTVGAVTMTLSRLRAELKEYLTEEGFSL